MKPPKSFKQLFRWFCEDDFFEELQGDLEEKFHTNLDEFGSRYAKRQYRREVLQMIRPSVIKPKNMINFINWSLLQHAFKASFRNLKKQRAYSLLNVAGFAAALSICLFCLNAIYSNQQLDQKFNDKELIYRVNTKTISPTNTGLWATSHIPLYEKIRDNIPEANQIAILQNGAWAFEAFLKGAKRDLKTSAVNEDFFEVFNYDVLYGDPSSIFNNPAYVVITEEVMDKYFEPESVIGASIGPYIVGAVIETPNKVSHLKFDVLNNDLKDKDAGMFYTSWTVFSLQQLYIKRNPNSKDSVIQGKLDLIANEINEELKDREKADTFGYQLEALKEVASSDASLNQGTLMTTGAQGIVLTLMFILLGICTFNYTNLAMASAIARTKEIAVRKVMGSKKSALVLQFLAETVILSFMAFLIGLLLFKWLAPKFATFSDFYFATTLGLRQVTIFFLFTIGMAVFSGFIPGLIFSNISLLQLFKKTKPNSKLSIKHLKKGMITLQLSISLFVFILGFFLYSQAGLITNQENPFAKGNIVAVQIPTTDTSNFVFRNELRGITGVNSVTTIERLPFVQVTPKYRLVKSHAADDPTLFLSAEILEADTSVLQILEGSIKWFGEKPKDISRPFFLGNAKFSETLSDSAFHVSNGMYSLGNEEYFPVLGEVDNLMGADLAVDPAAAAIKVNPNTWPLSFLVELTPNAFKSTLSGIESLYQDRFPNEAFQPYFMEDMLDRSLYQFRNIMKAVLFVLGSIIIITIMGQIGMSMYMAQTKEKEIGIRKVLGANFRQIVHLVLKSTYIKLVIGTLVACPLAFWFYKNAVPDFTIPLEIGIEDFVFGVIAFSLMLLSLITLQTWSTTRADPADTLRSE